MSNKAKIAKNGRNSSPTERQLGALKLRRINIPELNKKRFLPFAFADGMRLFYGPTLFEVAKVAQRFEELGLSDLLVPLPEPTPDESERFDHHWNLAGKEVESAKRICETLGAKAASIETFGEDDPPEWREFAEPEAEAWFLTLFASFYRRQADAAAKVEERLHWAQSLGRLLERWRWWSKGHDAEAVYGRPFKDQKPDKATRGRGSKAERREHHIIAVARGWLRSDPVRFRHKSSGKINQSEVERRYLDVYPGALKKGRIRHVIGEAIRKGILA